jgi:hypothetical protein
MMFPAFLGIGAQKAGTTWLHSMLSTHEEIWLPHLKELHYFDRKFPIKQISNTASRRPGRGVITRHIATRLRRFDASKLIERLSIRRFGDLTWEFRYLFGDWNDEWYASLFDNARGRLAGEITPAYSCLGETAISHVHSLMPNAKLILLLRDPIDRAWSHAKMDLSRAARRTAEQIDDSQYVAHFNGSASRLRGDYLGTIRRWQVRFPENQLFLGFYDEILSNPEELLLRILQFLGVSASERNIPCQVHARVNPGQPVPIPLQLHQHLAALYIDDLRELAKQFGSYPCRWLEQCETALRDAPSY